MAKDKKGKGSGSKDACYHKVKSRYSVWPSAYASGALVKCRKVGAANWGNKSESFEVQEGGNFMRGKDSQIARSTGAGALTPDAAKQLGKKAEDLQKKKAAKVDVPKFKKEEVESVEEGKSDRPMGEPFHTMSRGMKQKRGAKRNEGDGKYLRMQTTKKQNKKSADLDAHRERQRNERGLSMYPEEVEQVDERTRYAKETGKDFKTGNPSEKGGTRTGDTAFDQVSREMRNTGGVISSRKNAIPPQGKKKEKGAKGYKGVTPVDKIKNRLAQKKRAQEYNPYKPRMGESD